MVRFEALYVDPSKKVIYIAQQYVLIMQYIWECSTQIQLVECYYDFLTRFILPFIARKWPWLDLRTKKNSNFSAICLHFSCWTEKYNLYLFSWMIAPILFLPRMGCSRTRKRITLLSIEIERGLANLLLGTVSLIWSVFFEFTLDQQNKNSVILMVPNWH